VIGGLPKIAIFLREIAFFFAAKFVPIEVGRRFSRFGIYGRFCNDEYKPEKSIGNTKLKGGCQ